MTINQVDEILTSIGYYDSFEKLMNEKYQNINYGKRIGTLSFDSLFDADKKYAYNGIIDNQQFVQWNEILISKDSTEDELLIVCLKIFDWGNVLTGNVKTAIELYEQNKLKKYLHYVSNLLKSKNTIEKVDIQEPKIIWSSGWTKVYSFINNEILIYDSRVSAFLKFSLIQNYNNLSEEENLKFHNLSSLLFNFSGAPGRERKISTNFGFKNQHPKGVKGLNANLISSWITQLTKQKLGLQENIRSFERAFFMLGFDLKQIKTITNNPKRSSCLLT